MATATSTPASKDTRKKLGSGGFRSKAGKTFGKLEQVFDDVWWTWGSVTFAPGVTFPRNMAIVREKGELVVIHPVMMPEATQREIEALGPIKHIVKLGAFHGMDDLAYFQRYQPTVWAPPGCDETPGLTRHEQIVPGGKSPLAGATIYSYEKSRSPEAVMILPRHGGVMFSCDSVQNWENAAGLSMLGKVMARMMGFTGRACIGPGWRKQCEPKDGSGFKPHFDELVAMDWKHLVSAHGTPVKDTARDDLRAQVSRIYK